MAFTVYAAPPPAGQNGSRSKYCGTRSVIETVAPVWARVAKAYISFAWWIWRRFATQMRVWERARAFIQLGNASETKIAIIRITTIISTSVNPRSRGSRLIIAPVSAVRPCRVFHTA